MNSQQLLFLGLLIGTALVLFLIFSRNKRRGPVLLRMKDDPAPAPQPQLEQPVSVAENLASEPVPAPEPEPPPPKTLKVYFAFNSHDWEAYEALGVPINAKLTTVTKMYQHLIKTSDSSTFDFYESAYNAIIKKRKESP